MGPTIPSNDVRAVAAVSEPDAHGQAALLLAESTLHALVENATFTATEAADVVRSAAEVKVEIVAFTGESRARMQASLDLLDLITVSFSADADPRDPPHG
jgi:hypothetical protein